MNNIDLINNVKNYISDLKKLDNVLFVDSDDIHRYKLLYGQETICDNYNFTSYIKIRSTAQTVYISSDDSFSEYYTQKKKDIQNAAIKTVEAVFRYLSKCPLINISGRIADNSDFTIACDLYLSNYRKDTAHLAVMFKEMTFDITGDETDQLSVVCIPEWPEKDRQVLVFDEIGVTIILGSDYYGEIKSAFLRMAIDKAKEKDMLGLHAATKIMAVQGSGDRLKKVGVVIFGISSTGKTTHACHDHGLNEPGEYAQILQDDLVFWKNDGSIIGSERGFYIKTDSLNDTNQPLLYNAAKMPGALLENVIVDYQGRIYFDDKTVTTNAHAIISRENLKGYTSDTINMPKAEDLDRLVLFFMTKNFTVVPIISRLTAEQASVAFMLSEPFDAMGSEIGKIDGKGGLSSLPIGIGNAVDDVNKFYERLKDNPNIECYMLNNGGIGELVDVGLDGGRRVRRKVQRITIPEMSKVMKAVFKNDIEWIDDNNWMVEIPRYIDGVDMDKYNIYNHYNQAKIDSLIAAVRNERRAFSGNYKGLNKNIIDACEF